MRLKWYGAASILLDQDGTQLLFDPFLSLNDKVFKPPIDELAAVENVFVTHGHLDHIVDIPAILNHNVGKATVYCTAIPRDTLISKGVDKERIRRVKPGDVLSLGPFEISVYKSRHIVYDVGLLLTTALSPRLLLYLKNLRYMLNENRACVEAGETVVFQISASGYSVLLMGSLNLDEETVYPKNTDLLVLPFQGRSGVARYAMPFIERLRPKKVLLDHFDNSFPPISADVKTARFISLMAREYPDVPLICTRPSADWVDLA